MANIAAPRDILASFGLPSIATMAFWRKQGDTLRDRMRAIITLDRQQSKKAAKPRDYNIWLEIGGLGFLAKEKAGMPGALALGRTLTLLSDVIVDLNTGRVLKYTPEKSHQLPDASVDAVISEDKINDLWLSAAIFPDILGEVDMDDSRFRGMELSYQTHDLAICMRRAMQIDEKWDSIARAHAKWASLGRRTLPGDWL